MTNRNNNNICLFILLIKALKAQKGFQLLRSNNEDFIDIITSIRQWDIYFITVIQYVLFQNKAK